MEIITHNKSPNQATQCPQLYWHATLFIVNNIRKVDSTA